MKTRLYAFLVVIHQLVANQFFQFLKKKTAYSTTLSITKETNVARTSFTLELRPTNRSLTRSLTASKTLVRRASSSVPTTSILKKVIGSPRQSWSMVAVKLLAMNTLRSVQLSSSPSSIRSSKLSPISFLAI